MYELVAGGIVTRWLAAYNTSTYLLCAEIYASGWCRNLWLSTFGLPLVRVLPLNMSVWNS